MIKSLGAVLSPLLANLEANDVSKAGVAKFGRTPAALLQAGLGLWGSEGSSEIAVPLELLGIPGMNSRLEIIGHSTTTFLT